MRERKPRLKSAAKRPARKKKPAGTATYVYGLVRSARAPSLEAIPGGPPDLEPPRLLEAGDDLWIVAATAPLERFSAAKIEAGLKDLAWVTSCAVGHEAVVEHFTRSGVPGKGAVVPMKLFTLFTTDERALEHVAAARADLDAVLERVEGCVEWGVRVSLDEARARKAAVATPDADGSGASFLARKKKARDAQVELKARARERVDAVHERLAALAREARRRPPGPAEAGSRLLLDGAYLVLSKSQASFERAVQALADELAPAGYDVVLTGPWPAYNFVGEAAP